MTATSTSVASPLRWWEINLAFVLAAVIRGLLDRRARGGVAMPIDGEGNPPALHPRRRGAGR